ncbi:AAA family ATPase [Tateyamaria sp. Alg231-49]|uniref:AAA family ATPase n=1 Tax=Tateyamaria sp. Alg231-49 TaxID=1922219 RepID=UPI000D54CDB4|nr:AAA family ATPase [Tateyamaria sp. Alg231-49]
MMITSISLRNVRRFVEPVTIDKIGPGLNVLSAPNESGKSTFFDALQAGFFESHRSQNQRIKGLTPRVGGDPEVTIRFDLDGASWELFKRWSSSGKRKQASLKKDGVLIAQGEQAEDTLANMVAAPKEGGPAALLWVRQGVVEVSSDSAENTARQDIMKLVTGEVESMTVGRRMDRALKACDEVLKANVTTTGKPKTGGPLQRASETVTDLTGQRDDALERVTALEEALRRRRSVNSELAELRDEEETTAQLGRLKEAEKRFSEAEKQDADVQLSQSRVDALEAKESRAREKVEKLRLDFEGLVRAQSSVRSTAERTKKAQGAFDKARGRRELAKVAQNKAQAAYNSAAEQLKSVMRAEASAGAVARREELMRQTADAEKLRAEIETLKAEIGQEISSTALEQLDGYAAALTVAERARESAAPILRINYDATGMGKVRRGGEAVEGDRDYPITEVTGLQISGVGHMSIKPNDGAGDGGVDAAQKTLDQALDRTGYSSIEAARASAQTRVAKNEQLRTKEAEFKAIAPKGVEQLRAALAELPAVIEKDVDLPTRADAEKAEAETQRRLDAASLDVSAAAEAFETLREALEVDQRKAASAEAHLQAAQTALSDVKDPEAEIASQNVTLQMLVEELTKARSDLATLRDVVIDLEAAKVAVARAKSVIENSRTLGEKLERELAGLTERIRLSSSDAPDEELAFLNGQLEAAETRLTEIEFDVEVNQRLKAALDAARKAALEAHVKPVSEELQPLLRMLWPDAEPDIDAESGTITRITRSSVEEDFEVLSGGTREQISLMVRLAFANILAKQGRSAPLILDDAIVYTDDDRIEQMFNALTLRSSGLQIIVLSCRQRAFRGLGGDLLSINRVDDAA